MTGRSLAQDYGVLFAKFLVDMLLLFLVQVGEVRGSKSFAQHLLEIEQEAARAASR